MHRNQQKDVRRNFFLMFDLHISRPIRERERGRQFDPGRVWFRCKALNLGFQSWMCNCDIILTPISRKDLSTRLSDWDKNPSQWNKTLALGGLSTSTKPEAPCVFPFTTSDHPLAHRSHFELPWFVHNGRKLWKKQQWNSDEVFLYFISIFYWEYLEKKRDTSSLVAKRTKTNTTTRGKITKATTPETCKWLMKWSQKWKSLTKLDAIGSLFPSCISVQ